MNLLSRIFGMLPLIPALVTGIEVIHGEAKQGADKKTMAMQALGLAVGAAETVLPGEQENIQIAQQMASSIIDGAVALFNKNGWPHQTPAPAK